jgi:hypothetical protein
MELPPRGRRGSSGRTHVAAIIGFAILATIAMSACSRNNLAASGAALELRAV